MSYSGDIGLIPAGFRTGECYLLDAVFEVTVASVYLPEVAVGEVLAEDENQEAHNNVEASGDEECDSPCGECRVVTAAKNRHLQLESSGIETWVMTGRVL
jgi:hypothetical protein